MITYLTMAALWGAMAWVVGTAIERGGRAMNDRRTLILVAGAVALALIGVGGLLLLAYIRQ